jgi:hypothetical protein
VIADESLCCCNHELGERCRLEHCI